MPRQKKDSTREGMGYRRRHGDTGEGKGTQEKAWDMGGCMGHGRRCGRKTKEHMRV